MKGLATLHRENLKVLLRQKILFVYGIAVVLSILIGLLNVSKDYLYQETLEISDGTEWKFFLEDTQLSNESISIMIEKYLDVDVSNQNRIDVQDRFIVGKIKKVYGENWNTADNAKKNFFDERSKLIKEMGQNERDSLSSLREGYVEGWKVVDTLFPKVLYLTWVFILLVSIPLYHKSQLSGFHEISISTKYGKNQVNKMNWLNAYELATGMFIFGIVLLYLFVWSKYGLDGYKLRIQTIPKYFLATSSWSLLKTFLIQILIAYLTTLIILNISLIISIVSKSVKVGYGLAILLGACQLTLLRLFGNNSQVTFVNYLAVEIFKVENFIFIGRIGLPLVIALFFISGALLYEIIKKREQYEYV